MEAVVPIGFMAVFTGWHWMAAVAQWLLNVSARIADWHAAIEPAWRVPDPPLWLALAFTVSLLTLAIAARRRVWRWPAGLAVLAFFILLLWDPWPPRIEPHTLELTAIDVGQGDSLLVVFPGGQCMVVDGGGLLQFGSRRRARSLDIGEDVVSPYLWSRGIRNIDILVATHAHADHSGGIGALLENFKPRELWTGAYPLAGVVERAARLHVPVRELRASPAFDYGGARIEILSPPADYAAAQPGNNDSLAMRITYGARSILLTGDMESPREARLLADERAIRADVLKVGHHGSKTSTTQDFLDAVHPSVAVISAGFENSFGHPHRDVIGRLADRHSEVLRTDLEGLITVRSDGRRITVDTMAWQGGSAWWRGERPANWGTFNWAMSAGW
jgi:competence protein ComEC